MFCIGPVISGPCVVVPAVPKFVQISMKHGLLCVVWQFEVDSLPKWDRSLIRRRQEILKQIWELTFELGVLTGTDPSVWQLSILPLIDAEQVQVPSEFGWWGGMFKTWFSRAILALQFWFWLWSISARVTFPCSRNLRATSVAHERVLPTTVEISMRSWQDWDIVKSEYKFIARLHLIQTQNAAQEVLEVLLQVSWLFSLSDICGVFVFFSFMHHLALPDN